MTGRRMLCSSIAVVFAVALFFFLVSINPAAATVLRVATHSSGPGTPRSDYLVHFAKAVEERTGGQVKVQIFWANSLVHAKEALEAVQVGTADMADLALAYFPDKLRLIQVSTLPFSVSDPVQQRDRMLDVIEKVPEVRKEFEKFDHVLIAVTATADYHLPSRIPIKNLEELRGKKVGTFGRLIPRVVRAIGAVPVSISAGEMYEALQRGTIDARVLSYEATQRFKLHDVARFISEVSVGAVAGANFLTINRTRWESLSPEQRKIILQSGREVGEWEAGAIKNEDLAYQEFLKGKGMQIIKFPAEDIKRWRNHPDARQIADEWIEQMEKQGLPGRRVYSTFVGQ